MIGVQNDRIFIVLLVLDTENTPNIPLLVPSLRIGLVPFQYGDLETVLEFINVIFNRSNTDIKVRELLERLLTMLPSST